MEQTAEKPYLEDNRHLEDRHLLDNHFLDNRLPDNSLQDILLLDIRDNIHYDDDGDGGDENQTALFSFFSVFVSSRLL